MHGDTIVAVATADGVGGLSVVRISGPAALVIANKVFRPGFPSACESHKAVYGILGDPKSNTVDTIDERVVVDQVIALPMLSPNSFTGDDTVEFFCHGGTIVSQMVVSACRQAGARPATAGEFTRRAFLNGKMTLDQAEAVADLIHADSEIAARAAIKQLLGGFNQQLIEIEKPLLELLSFLEGGLEFVEEDIPGMETLEIRNILKTSVFEISNLLSLAPAGRLLREGIHVVLQGEPNAGKSSLFNKLVETDRAIVDPEAGTTRDVVSSRVVRHGRVYIFHDTAGLRSSGGRIENKGIERTKEAVKTADVVLSLNVAGETLAEFENNSPDAVFVDVLTKADLLDESLPFSANDDCVVTSSVNGQGIDELWTMLESKVEFFELNKAVSMGVVLNERHRFKLQNSRNELEDLLTVFKDETTYPGDEVIGTLLASILSQLGEISGRVFSEQLLESVFSRFCVGK
ncbi:MAG: tRNA uridine-5-carboxymethylaminomethyl(34) synthesis GTPase MnmE [bacterium]|nr:tRNA uridine-5-carboxymethylaminomethyl(34) synthesis GTPase MnmE [bacterium]